MVDDASGDEGATLAAAKAADDGTGRLILLALEQNGGPARARNAAIAASKAPWITILDSDDFFEPGRLNGLVAQAGQRLRSGCGRPEAGGRRRPASTARPMWFNADDQQPVVFNFTTFMEASTGKVGLRRRREPGFLKPMMRRTFLAANAISYDERMRLGRGFRHLRAIAARRRSYAPDPLDGLYQREAPHITFTVHSRHDLVELEAANDRLLASSLISPGDAKLVREASLQCELPHHLDRLRRGVQEAQCFRVAWVVLKDPRQAALRLQSLPRHDRSRTQTRD